MNTLKGGRGARVVQPDSRGEVVVVMPGSAGLDRPPPPTVGHWSEQTMARVGVVSLDLNGPLHSPTPVQLNKGREGTANHWFRRANHPLQLGLVPGHCCRKPYGQTPQRSEGDHHGNVVLSEL